MTATLGVIAVLMLGATLMIGAQSAFAQTVLSTVSTEPGQFSELPHSDHPQAAYQSGFQHGVIDGNMSSKQHRILTSQNMALHGIHRSLSKGMSMDTVAYQPTKMWELMMIGPHFTVLMVQALRNGS
jgi:hypothetical protein